MAPLRNFFTLLAAAAGVLIFTGSITASPVKRSDDASLAGRLVKRSDDTSLTGRIVKRSDDVSLAGLQSLVQQQAAAIQTLQARTSALEVLRDDVTRLTAASTPVAFTVRSSADPITVGVGGIVPFDQVVTSEGGGFDPLTGIFTAPVSGLYAFFLTTMARCDVGKSAWTLTRGGKAGGSGSGGEELELVWVDGGIACQDQAAATVTARLQASQQMYARHHSGATSVRGHQHTTFTGFLLHA